MFIIKTLQNYLSIALICIILFTSNIYVNDTLIQTILFLILGSTIITLQGILYLKSDKIYIDKKYKLPILLMLLFIIYIIIKYIIAKDEIETINSFFKILCCFIISISLLNQKNVILYSKHVFSVIIIVSCIEALICLLQFLELLPSLNTFFKVTGTELNPNITAIFLCLTLPAFFYKIYNTNLKLIYSIALFFILIVITILKCRTALIGSFLEVIFFINWKINFFNKFKKQLNFSKKIIIIFIAICILGFGLVYAYQIKKASANGRKLVWQLSTKMTLEKPIFGFGYGNFSKEYNLSQAKYFNENSANNEEISNASYTLMAYNEYVENLVEGGLIGFSFYFILLFLLPIYYQKNISWNDLDYSNYSKYSVVAILICAILSLVNFTISTIPIMAIFILYLSILFNVKDVKKCNIISNRIVIKLFAILFLIIGTCCMFYSISYSKIQKIIASTITNLKNGNKKAAYDNLELITSNINKNSTYYYLKGNYYMGNKDFLNAKIMYINASKYLSSPEVYQQIGVCNLLLKKVDSAIKNFEIAKNIQPNRYTPLYLLMNTYLQVKDTINAKVYAIKILNSPVKIPSDKINSYKNDAEKLLTKLNQF